MKILVTGATGFLGSYLVKSLLDKGHDVSILKRSFSDTWRIATVLEKLYVYNIDKCSIQQPFKDHGRYDAIIHTATCYGRNGESAQQICEANTVFPLQLLETAIAYNTATFFNTDTVLKKYLNKYSMSKKQFMEWGKKFANEDAIKFVNIQLEHFFGPKDDESKFTTYVMNSCVQNRSSLKLTEGEQKRDFIYISDVVDAYLLLLQKLDGLPEQFQDYSVGSGSAISIRDFVEIVHQLSNSKTYLDFGAIPYREGEIMESKADITLLKKLGWMPTVSIIEGVTKCLNEGVMV